MEAFQRTGYGKLLRAGPECREIFRYSTNTSGYTQEKFIEDLRGRGRAKADIEVQGQFFQLKRAYEVWDKASLKMFILGSRAMGIEEDEKLRLCYPRVLQDMDELIEEGWVREVKIVETKRSVQTTTRVFFPRNQNDSEVEFTKQELPENCQEYLAGLW